MHKKVELYVNDGYSFRRLTNKTFFGETIMKRVLICSVAAALMLMAVKVGFSEEKAKAADANVLKKAAPGPAKGPGGVDRMEAMKKASEKRMSAEKEKHDAEIKKWEDIKKLAIEEKATKTAAAIDKVIAEENEEFKTKMERQEKMMEMMREKPKGPPAADAEKAKPEKSEAGK